ncbi:MAG: hypothetical protein EA385_13020 [Salinarimonadaceae bacterium]|nr:MAG: hypothetical protein EA385_13020 [Salinarimonadaceae bacterium]
MEQRETLVAISVPLDGAEQRWRRLYGTPEFIEWLDSALPLLRTTVIGGETEPYDQVDAIFHEYIIGERMQFDRRFKKLARKPDKFVWEFKTLDIRIFGWIPMRDVFICTFGDMKDEIETRRLYGRYIAQTIYVRNTLDLDEPKYVPCAEYDDVLSDA